MLRKDFNVLVVGGNNSGKRDIFRFLRGHYSQTDFSNILENVEINVCDKFKITFMDMVGFQYQSFKDIFFSSANIYILCYNSFESFTFIEKFILQDIIGLGKKIFFVMCNNDKTIDFELLYSIGDLTAGRYENVSFECIDCTEFFDEARRYPISDKNYKQINLMDLRTHFLVKIINDFSKEYKKAEIEYKKKSSRKKKKINILTRFIYLFKKS